MTYADDLRDLAYYNEDKELYYKVKKYYESLRGKMKDEAIKGNWFIYADSKDVLKSVLATNILNSFARQDGIEITYYRYTNKICFSW